MLALILQSATGNAQYAQGNQAVNQIITQSKLLELLVCTNHSTLLNATIQLDAERQQRIGSLMSLLSSTNAIESKVGVMVLLGKYRASEAVPSLVSNLEWEANLPVHAFMATIPTFPQNDESFEIDQEPISGALCNIGIPAVVPLLNKIRETDDAKVIIKCAIICSRIEGSEVTQFRLQELLGKEADHKQKERIQSALDALKELNPEK